MSGYSFKVESPAGESTLSPWLGAETLFTTPQLQRRYEAVEISLLTPKVTLVPEHFFNPAAARMTLGDVVNLREGDSVEWVPFPSFGAVVLYSNSLDESLSKVISQTVLTTSGEKAQVLPEMYYILRDLYECKEYNKIVASWQDSYLHLGLAQGKSLLLSNVYYAPDFVTAEYFIFLALRKLQFNPEMSTIFFRTPLSEESEMSLYRYFRSVERI